MCASTIISICSVFGCGHLFLGEFFRVYLSSGDCGGCKLAHEREWRERGESENAWNASCAPSTFCSPVASSFLRFLNVGVGELALTERGATLRPNSTFESRTMGRRKNVEMKMPKGWNRQHRQFTLEHFSFSFLSFLDLSRDTTMYPPLS